jgi:hypothetical protein
LCQDGGIYSFQSLLTALLIWSDAPRNHPITW